MRIVPSPILSILIRGMGMKMLTKLFLHFLDWPGRSLTQAEPEEPRVLREVESVSTLSTFPAGWLSKK